MAPSLPLFGTPNPSEPESIPNSSLPSTYALISSPTPVRKSERISQKPSYLKDFVCNSIFLRDVTNSCFVHSNRPTAFAFAALSIGNQHVLHSLSILTKPKSFVEASKHAGWQQAMKDEHNHGVASW